MTQSMFSQSWYRVAELTPRLRGHVRIHEHRYRDVLWRIVEDPQSGKYHRLTPAAYFIVSMMNGQRSMREIWEMAEQKFGSRLPSQDDVIRLLAQLYGADLLVGDTLPDLVELDRRSGDIARRNMMARVKNPMAIRIPLLDPDRFLSATLPLVRWLFSPIGAFLWLALVFAGGLQAVVHWPELSSNLSDRVLSVENIMILLLVYPFIKAVHELGHAYAIKRWGGEVHEIGLMFLVLLPVPYVDASASIAFREWWRRAIVGGAGILVELGLAAAAILLWVQMEPGLIRAALFNIALIGSVSTVLFNGNPLLRFDGYYVMADAIGIPNLGTRSNKYLGYLAQRYLFGLETAETPVVAKGERRWFVFYAIASFFYRLSVMAAIALFVATKFFVVGVVLALLVVFNMALLPAFKSFWFVIANPVLRQHRARAVSTTLGGVGLVLALFFFVPTPYATTVQGVVWLSENSAVRAGTAGEVAELLAEPGSRVDEGADLFRLSDPRLDASVVLQKAHLNGLRTQYLSVATSDPVTVRLLRAEIERAEDELRRLERRQSELVVRAPRDGHWILPAPDDLVGAFLGRGEPAGNIVRPDDRDLRVVVPQADIAAVRNETQDVSVRFVHELDVSWPAQILRQVPAGNRELPSVALSNMGGGPFALDPQVRDVPTALQTVFQFDLALVGAAAQFPRLFPGERLYARFDHGYAPMATWMWRGVRRLFLRTFNV